MPKFVDSSRRARQAAVHADLRLIREAVGRFKNDTGAWPAQLSQLVKDAAPAAGVDSSGNSVAINAGDWHGPYLRSLPKDPIAGTDYNYANSGPKVGNVTSSANAEGNAADGT